MTITTSKFPILYIAAWVITATGLLGLFVTLFIEPKHTILKGMVLISAALIIFGLGEFLNHPKEKSFMATEQGDTKRREYIRRRNTCGLGNLCIIVALLLFFIGLSSLIF